MKGGCDKGALAPIEQQASALRPAKRSIPGVHEDSGYRFRMHTEFRVDGARRIGQHVAATHRQTAANFRGRSRAGCCLAYRLLP